MDILLSETELNLLMLLEELTKHQDWIQDSSLSENLNLSAEELQEHLSLLEQLFPNLLIRSTKEGIQLQFEDRNSLDPKIAIFEQSPTYSFLNQLFFKDRQSFDQICQVLSANPEQIEEIIHRLNILLPQHYNISIQPSPLNMMGTEEDIRAFYLDYFSQSYSFLDWPFPSISEECLTDLIQLFLKTQ